MLIPSPHLPYPKAQLVFRIRESRETVFHTLNVLSEEERETPSDHNIVNPVREDTMEERKEKQKET